MIGKDIKVLKLSSILFFFFFAQKRKYYINGKESQRQRDPVDPGL